MGAGLMDCIGIQLAGLIKGAVEAGMPAAIRDDVCNDSTFLKLSDGSSGGLNPSFDRPFEVPGPSSGGLSSGPMDPSMGLLPAPSVGGPGSGGHEACECAG